MKKVTITAKQRKTYSKKGNNLIKSGLTTGFQLEDFDPKTKGARIQYGHDTPSHLNIVNKKVGGNRHGRESYYKWDSSWTPGANTKLLFNKTLAHEKGEYIQTKQVNKADKYFKSKTIKGNKGAVRGSWDVPDFRIVSGKKKPGYKTAYQVTKNIDHNSRLSTVVKSKKKLQKIRRKLKGEKVRKIQVQNVKKHSFFDFIS